MTHKMLLLVLRLIVGGVFVFSGFVKVIDPLGFTYKMEDYLMAMGPFFAYFSPLALLASMLLSSFEMVVGLGLILGARLKESTIGAALLMLFMVPLTLWTAIANPVTDCGCFGDAVVIDNWTTFWKNIVISALIAGIFYLLKHQRSPIGKRSQWSVIVFSFIFAVGLSVYNYNRLPIIDFRPYKVGTNILEGMQIPDDAVQDSFSVKLVYAKDGVEQEFSMDNYPRNDSSWTFVDQVSVLVRKGYEPPIHDFSITHEDADITDFVLENEGYTFLLVSYNITKANIKYADEINKIYQYANENGYGFYALTASSDEEVDEYRNASNAEYPIAIADPTTLKTVIRSNPGLLLIKDATVMSKWPASKLPRIDAPLENTPLGAMKKDSPTKKVISVTIFYLILLAVILGIDRLINNKRD